MWYNISMCTEPTSEKETLQPQSCDEGRAKRRYIRVRELQGRDRVLRIVNFCLGGAIFLASVIWAVYRLATMGLADKDLRAFIGICMAVLAVLPFIIERIFRFHFSGFILLVYLVFLLFAGYIGSALGMYVPWRKFHYDKIVHGIFGYIACVAGLYIFCKMTDYNKSKAVFAGLFCFVVSLCCASCWEIIEFTNDRLFGASAQGDKVFEGFATVEDTMWDIISNFFGAIVFTVQYALHRATKKNLLIGSMVGEFTTPREYKERTETNQA